MRSGAEAPSTEAAIAAAIASPDAAPEGLTDGRGRPAPDRFAVYRNNVMASLCEALGASFPKTEELLGTDYFRAVAAAYASREKPKTPLLWQYGEGFADFLAGLPGVAPYPFVPEVTRLERVRVLAYHAADAAPLSPDALVGLSEDDIGAVRLLAHPASALVPLSPRALSAWFAGDDELPDLRECDAALVTRPGDVVRVTPLRRAERIFCRRLLEGATLQAAATVADAETAVAGEFDLATALGKLFAAGAFQAAAPAQVR